MTSTVILSLGPSTSGLPFACVSASLFAPFHMIRRGISNAAILKSILAALALKETEDCWKLMVECRF